ncbi:unnamed protein product [Trifolium pratense]|uniref:Uncharacterized protein n=1 Tax=Trifolium pratense TaxID=57577 RepID=A0ACB0IKY2_TRIPR|nr:unnamed protein product [Trifolium pratense]
MEELCCMLGYDSCFSVDCEGRGGGLALMWFSSFQCSVTNFSSNHIDIEVMDSGSGNWRLTGFYGFPGSCRRRDSWNFLRHLSRLSPQPWCIIGLVDVHMEGYPITWFKSLGTNRAVEERRALANEAWSQLFPNVILENLAAPASDHYPILLKQNSVLDPVISTIDHSISSDDNIMLTAQFTLEEFKEAMFSMNPDKCPGPDGFNPIFFSTILASLFFTCPSSLNIWSMSTIFPSVSAAINSASDATALIFQLLHCLTAEESSTFACILWSIWKQRNNKLWNNIVDAQNFVYMRALLQEWKLVHEATGGVPSNQNALQVIKWTKPTTRRFKCNIDASFSSQYNKVGIDICIRDELGAFVLARYDQFTPVRAVHMEKLLAYSLLLLGFMS